MTWMSFLRLFLSLLFPFLFKIFMHKEQQTDHWHIACSDFCWIPRGIGMETSRSVQERKTDKRHKGRQAKMSNREA